METFERAVMSTMADQRVLILRMGWVPFIDVTALKTLEQTLSHLKKRGVRVILTGTSPRVKHRLEKAGIVQLVGQNNVLNQFSDALHIVRQLPP